MSDEDRKNVKMVISGHKFSIRKWKIISFTSEIPNNGYNAFLMLDAAKLMDFSCNFLKEALFQFEVQL